MSSLMTTTRHIAPGAPVPVPLAPAAPGPVQAAVPTKPHEEAPPVIGANDIIFVNGQAFNGRGYPVCGVANQRGRLCGRIGSCPFHSKKNSSAKRPRSGVSTTDASTSSNSTSGKAMTGTENETGNGPLHTIVKPGGHTRSAHPAIRQMAIPPRRSRFKRSWTTDEHRRFLQAMRRHGKGKWKEIAVEVKTRNANQCQSHAQKYFLRQAKSDSERKKKSIHDVTEADMSQETAAHGATSLVWPPMGLQALPQGVPTSATSTHPAAVSPGGVSVTPIASRPATSGVPLAPRLPAEKVENVSVVGRNASAAGNLHPHIATGGNGFGVGMSEKSTHVATWGGPAVSRDAKSSDPMSTMVSAQATHGAANSLISRNSSGSPTIPVVFPMTSLGLSYAPMVSSFMNTSMANPGNAAVVAPPPPSKTRVTVHVNGRLKGGMALMLPESFSEFFEHSRSKLQFEGTFARVFTRSGGEITSTDEMCQDDMLWLSTGEDFLTPR